MGTRYEREHRNENLEPMGWLVTRGAGSMGLDLHCSRPHPMPDFTPIQYPVSTIINEVKSTGDDTFYVSNHAKSQEQWMVSERLARHGYKVVWSVRFKRGDAETRWQHWPLRSVDDSDGWPILRRGDGYTTGEVFG